MSSRVDDLLRKYSAHPGSNAEIRASGSNRISNNLHPNTISNNYDIKATTNYVSEFSKKPVNIETFGGGQQYGSEFSKVNPDYSNFNKNISITRESYNPIIPPTNTNFSTSNLNQNAQNMRNSYKQPSPINSSQNNYSQDIYTSKTSYNQNIQPAQNNYSTSNYNRDNFDVGKFNSKSNYDQPASNYTNQNIYTSNSGSNKLVNTPSLPLTSSKSDIEPFVQQVIMSAELTRLSSLSNSNALRLQQRPKSVNDNSADENEGLAQENNRLRENLRDREFRMNDFKDENLRLKEREDGLKQKLNELNEDNKRLMNMHSSKQKGPWCC